jgi:GH35 family endo-1,4-beta-xylanase
MNTITSKIFKILLPKKTSPLPIINWQNNSIRKHNFFMNEYAMLNSIESPRNIRTYLDTIASMRAKGAPIDARLATCGTSARNPAHYRFGYVCRVVPPIQITEFDVNTPEELRGRLYT